MEGPHISAPSRPWMGLAEYTERESSLFFGREDEVRTLIAMIERDTLGVLFGTSGLGKTSLLKAGLAPALGQRRYLPIYVRLAHNDEQADLDQQVVSAVAKAAAGADAQGPVADEAGGGLWRYFHRNGHRFWDTDHWPLTPLLIFDQFEEIFTLGQENEARRRRSRALLTGLSDLVENRPPVDLRDRLNSAEGESAAAELSDNFAFEAIPVRVLLSLREDYLAYLEGLRDLFPTIRQNRMRLAPMTVNQARQVVEGPGRRFAEHRVLDDGATEAILEFVAAGRGEMSEGVLDDERPIEPAFLSLVCDRLYERRGLSNLISRDQVRAQRGEIIKTFYEESFEILADNIQRQDVRRFVEGELLSPSGHRDSRALDDALDRPRVTQTVLDALVKRRLLRYEDRPGGARRVELSHDVLLKVATDSRAERLQREREAESERQRRAEQERADRAQKETAEAQAQERRAKRLLRAAVVGLLAALVGIGFGLHGRWKAQAEAKQARAAHDQAAATAAQADFDLADLYLARGDDETPRALAHLARALRTRPDMELAASRAVSVMSLRAWTRLVGAALSHNGIVRGASFSPDGRRVVTASDDRTACIWDATTGEPLTEPLRHYGAVSAASFSPDGRRVVTASWDKTARIWDAISGKPLTGPLKHDVEVSAASFSLDGRQVVTASDDTVRIWDATSGKPLTGPLKHDVEVSAASFSPDGRRVVTASDATVRIWDATSGKPLTGPLKHERRVEAASFSLDGRRVVTASDATVRIWDATSGKLLVGPLEYEGAVSVASFSPDGRQVVTVSWDRTARIWDAATGKPLTEPLRHDDHVVAASFSPDGRRVVTASNHSARIWDATNGKLLTEPLRHDGAVLAATFSPDGRRVVTASDDRTARIWDATTGKSLSEPLRPRHSLVAASFSPDGRRVVTASDDRTAHIWDAVTGKPLSEPLKHDGGVVAASFTPDGRRGRTASEYRTARIWDAIIARALTKPLPRHSLVAASFSPDGRRVVTAFDHSARVWDAVTGKPLSEPLKHDGGVVAASFSPDGRRVVTASDDTARIWDATSGKSLTEPLKHDGSVLAASFGPDGRWVVTASRDKTARIWDAMTGKPLTEPLKHDGGVLAASFSPDGRRVVTASKDKTAAIWDAMTGKPLTESLKHDGGVLTASFSPDGRRVVTASEDRTANIWDATSGKALTEPLKHDGGVLAASFSPDGRRVVTASWDKTACIWDATTGKALTEPLKHDGGVLAASFSPDGRRVVTTSAYETVRTWDVTPPDPFALSWFPRWLEGVGGRRFDSEGLLQSVTQNEPIPINVPMDSFKRLALWLEMSGPKRPISPNSTRTVGEWVADRIAEGKQAAFAEAYDALPGDPLVLAAWASLLADSRTQHDRDTAIFYARYAADHSTVYAEDENERTIRPRQAEVHYRVALAWRKLEHLAEAKTSLETALRLDAGNQTYRAFKQELAAPH